MKTNPLKRMVAIAAAGVLALGFSAPLVNAESNSGATGVARVGNGSDISAVELVEPPQSGPNFVVNQSDDHDDGVCGPTDCTLREAINAANANADASAITFDVSPSSPFLTRQTITVSGDLPAVTTNVTITGSSAGVTVSAPTCSTGVIFISTGGTGGLFDLTFTSSASRIGVQNANGGNLTVTRCTVTGNNLGLIINSAPTVVRNCTFSGSRSIT